MAADARLVFVVSPFQNAFFHELADVLVDEIGALGGNAVVVTKGPIDPTSDDVYVLLPPHEYMALEGEVWAREPHLLERTIFITAEQPGSHFFHGNLAHAARAGRVFDFSPLSVRVYRQRGVRAEALPFGYARSWDRMPESPVDRPINVGFMGCITERRSRVLSGMTWLLQEPGTNLLISDNSVPNHSDSDGFLTGTRKRDVLASTKVLLNIHQTDEPYFEWLRVTEAVHCGTVVVSEPSVGTGIFDPGEHLLVATVESLPHVIQALLDDASLQERIRKAAYERLREVPVARAAEILLESAHALASRAVPHQVPPPERKAPLARPLPDFERLDLMGEQSVLRQAARETRLDLMELRRRLQRLDHTLQHGGERGAFVEVRHETPARRALVAPPSISVITALYNHREYVAAALDSVVLSTIGDVELVVVDDGSTDSSGDVVAAWFDRNPHVPGLLINHPVNRGLPAARNAALAFARAPLTFVLDADNEVLPQGFDLLMRALDEDPTAAFAYGVLERFDANGPVGILGYRGWSPEALRYINHIDAMALIRTEQLRAFEGYTTDRRLYGWEDYDLWCRIAEAGGHGVHVKSLVGRYRASATSMLAMTNISQIPAWAALQEHCPTLFAKTPTGTDASDPVGPVAARLRRRHERFDAHASS